MGTRKKGIPIFYFHKGNSYYLPYTVNQTKYYNPNSEIIFLGEESNQCVEKIGVTHVCYADYFEMASQMAEHYVHLNNNSYAIELLCMQRWLCVAEYVRKKEITGPFVLLDSDVLLYCNITEYVDKYMGEAEIAVCGKYCGPGYVIFKNVDVAEALAKSMLSWYQVPEKKQRLYQVYEELQALGNKSNVINDVKLLELVCSENQFVTHDMTQIIDGARFDSHIAREEPAFPLTHKGIKNIYMQNSIPYCHDCVNNCEVRYLSLHFQGGHKMRMFQYYTGDKKAVKGKVYGYGILLYQWTKRKLYKILK